MNSIYKHRFNLSQLHFSIVLNSSKYDYRSTLLLISLLISIVLVLIIIYCALNSSQKSMVYFIEIQLNVFIHSLNLILCPIFCCFLFLFLCIICFVLFFYLIQLNFQYCKYCLRYSGV